MIFNFFKKKTKNTSGNLFFKSNQDAFEYTQRYFTNYKLEAKSVYHGICLTSSLVQIHCLDNNNNNILTPVLCEKKTKDLNIQTGDFVLVGIEEVKELMNLETFKKLGIKPEKFNLKDKSNKDEYLSTVKKIFRESTKGVILKKLTLELDIKTHQFVFDE